jgi:hypothetical protein
VPTPEKGAALTLMEVVASVKKSGLQPLSFALYATTSIEILRPPPGGEGFVLCLEYASAVVGAYCREQLAACLKEPSPRQDGQEEHKSVFRPPPFTQVVPGVERFVCGQLRQWPGSLLPSPEDLNLLLAKLGAPDVRLKALHKEFSFEGNVEFAVPVRCANQLALLLGEMPALRCLKKVRPKAIVCCHCWKEGHSRAHCKSPAKGCRHCGQPVHKAEDGKSIRCPLLAGGIRSRWPPCSLCQKSGHCITSCPDFRPALVRMELKGKKALPQDSDFPVPPAPSAMPASAAAPRPAAAAATAAAVRDCIVIEDSSSASQNAGWTEVVRRSAPKQAAAAKVSVPPPRGPAAPARPSLVLSSLAQQHPAPADATAAAILSLQQQFMAMFLQLEARVTDLTLLLDQRDGHPLRPNHDDAAVLEDLFDERDDDGAGPSVAASASARGRRGQQA